MTDAEKLDKIRQAIEIAKGHDSAYNWATLLVIETILDGSTPENVERP